MTIQIRDSSAWKTVTFPYVRGDHYDNTSGQVWLPIHTIHVYDGNTGTWKEAFRNSDGNYPAVSPFHYTGATSYTVEQGVRFIKFRLRGGSGGGAGGLKLYRNDDYVYTQSFWTTRRTWHNITGGNGGSSEQFDTLIEVIPGENYSISPGGAGSAGNAHDARAVYGSAGSIYQNVSWSGNGNINNKYTASVGGSNGGDGGSSSVQCSARSIHIRASGGTGGVAASGTVQTYWQFWQNQNGDHNYALPGTFSQSGPSNSSQKSETLLSGTQASGASITKTNDQTISGGSGGSGGNTNISLSSGQPSSGSAGTAGYIEMTLYKKVP